MEEAEAGAEVGVEMGRGWRRRRLRQRLRRCGRHLHALAELVHARPEDKGEAED